MAKYVCPSCGASFHGKKCKNCAYESFSEEVAHNLHVHRGEPLVIRDTARKQIPYKDPFDCPPRRKQKTSAKITGLPKALLIVFLVIILNNALTGLFAAIESDSDWVAPETEAVTLPLNGKTLVDDDYFTIVAQWQDGQDDSTRIPIYIVNHTDKEFDFIARNVTVNGYCLDDFSSFYAQTKAGKTVEGELNLGEQGLQLANITQIQQIEFSFEANAFSRKSDNIESYMTDSIVLRGNAADDYVQTDVSENQVLYSDENLTLSYVCLWADSFDENLDDMELVFCVENSSTDTLSLYDKEILVNGESSDLSLWASAPANTKTLFTVYLYGINLPQAEDVQSFTMTLCVFPEGSEEYLIENISVPVN